VSAEPHLIHRVIARLNVGGPAMHVVNLAQAMNEGPWRTRLIAGSIESGEGDMAYYAEERGVEVSYVPAMARSIRPLSDLKTFWRLYRRFRRERPDIVHTHTAKAGTLGRLAAALAGVPVRVHTYHGHVLGGDYFSAFRTRVFVEIERQLGRLTDRLVVLTRGQAAELSGALAVAPPERFAVVPLGLELERFLTVDRAEGRGAMRAELGIEESELVVGTVGRLVPIKNHELFLDALAALVARADRPVRGLVVGSGEREDELRAYAAELGVDRHILWLGWRRDLPRIYPALDAVLLTSHDEGTPVAVIEALVAGTPVVARDVGGVAEVLESAGAGRPVPRDAGPERWASAALAAAEREAASPAERRRVAELFSVARLAADLDALYRAELA
jgi:glycosyltransferase involved in cell wall biosynthesis